MWFSRLQLMRSSYWLLPNVINRFFTIAPCAATHHRPYCMSILQVRTCDVCINRIIRVASHTTFLWSNRHHYRSSFYYQVQPWVWKINFFSCWATVAYTVYFAFSIVFYCQIFSKCLQKHHLTKPNIYLRRTPITPRVFPPTSLLACPILPLLFLTPQMVPTRLPQIYQSTRLRRRTQWVIILPWQVNHLNHQRGKMAPQDQRRERRNRTYALFAREGLLLEDTYRDIIGFTLAWKRSSVHFLDARQEPVGKIICNNSMLKLPHRPAPVYLIVADH